MKTVEYEPDNWVVLKIKDEKRGDFYKVLGGWSGGYTQGDSWRMNSGVESVTVDGDYYLFNGASGSVYRCRKDSNTVRMNIAGVLSSLQTEYPDKVEIMAEGIDWSKEKLYD